MLAPALVLVLSLLTAGCAVAPPLPVPPPRQAWLVPDRREAVVNGAAGPTGSRLAGVALLDGAGRRVFVTGADGKVDGVALDTGELLFRGEVTGTPIAALPGKVVAVLGPEGRLVLLDRDDGTLLFESEPGGGARGETITRLEYTAGRLWLEWSVTTSPGLACCAGGVRTTHAGVDVFELATGRLVARREAPFPGPAPGREELLQLPPGVQAEVIREAPVWSGPTATVARSLEVTIDGARSWSHPVPPARLEAPRPDASANRASLAP